MNDSSVIFCRWGCTSVTAYAMSKHFECSRNGTQSGLAFTCQSLMPSLEWLSLIRMHVLEEGRHKTVMHAVSTRGQGWLPLQISHGAGTNGQNAAWRNHSFIHPSILLSVSSGPFYVQPFCLLSPTYPRCWSIECHFGTV